MSIPDIQLAPGDTQPAYQIVLYQPNKANGQRGDPMDLFGKTVVLEYQLRGSTTKVIRSVVVLATGPAPDVNQGVVLVDWLTNGGAVASGNPKPLDYDARFVATDISGHQETWPNGPDAVRPDGSNAAFMWLQVSRDFRAASVPPAPAGAKLPTFATVDTVALLKAVVTALLLPGSSVYIVRENNKQYRLDGTSGLAEDPLAGILNTIDDPTLQWFMFG